MIAEFKIHATDGPHVYKEQAGIAGILASAGLPYCVDPMGTRIEGNWGAVIETIRRCHEAVAKGHKRVITTITIEDCKTEVGVPGGKAEIGAQHRPDRVPVGDMDREC